MAVAGAIATLGLFVDKSSGFSDLLVDALLLVPIALLLRAFQTTDIQDFPNLETLARTYAYYPKTYLRATVVGAAETVARNGVVIDRKARELNFAMAVLFGTVIVVLGWRVAEAWIERPTVPVSSTTPTAAHGSPKSGSPRRVIELSAP